MKAETSIFPGRWTQVLCVLAGFYGIVVAFYIFIETGKPSGASDFHQYWYAGHFVIQRHDPYAAFYAQDRPELPIQYLDGVTVRQYPVAQPNLELAATNTPAMVLLLTPFSYFSWNVAKWLFLVVNLFLLVVTGWLILRRIPFAGVKLAVRDELLLFLVYFDLSATRIAIENGTTTLAVFLLMLLAILYAQRSWWMSGLALGIALSKYSLSLPVFLFFLYKRDFKILLAAIMMQGLGVLALASITNTSPMAIAMENIRLFFDILNQPGVFVNLSSILNALTRNSLLAQISVFVMTVLVFVFFFRGRRGQIFKAPPADEVLDFHILTMLFIWTMLIGYHRLYDTLILVFFFILVFKGLAYPNVWNLNYKERVMLMVFLAAAPLVMILPERLVGQLISSYYGTISTGVTSAFFIIMLILTIYLLRRYLQNHRAEGALEISNSNGN